MAVSLVSTGITFPDATTQTTRATVTSVTLNNAGVTSVNGATGAVTVASGSQAFVAFGSTGGF